MVSDREKPPGPLTPLPQREGSTTARWYWQLPILWKPWWDTANERWLILAFPEHQLWRSVFYIWLTGAHAQDRQYAERAAAALNRIYQQP